MIAVRLELWPLGDETRAREIGRMYIANDGTGGATRGDYKVAVCRRGTTEVPQEVYPPDYDASEQPHAARAGQVKDYPRLSYNVWRLIARAVLSAFPEEVRAQKRNGASPVLDERIVRGLTAFASGTIGHPDDLAAAVEWLAAANADT